MRPSRVRKHDLADSRPGDQPQVNPHRLRRRRNHQVDEDNQEHISLPIEKVITHKERTPLIRSQTSLDSSSTVPVLRSDEMPSGVSLLPVGGNAPKLTKTGRVSKARKGVKGAHHCGCGKTYSRAEHLRRHQQNHEKRLPCLLCGKTFHRQDLYDRHLATKHDSTNSNSRRDSATSGSLISSLPPQTALSSSSSFHVPAPGTYISSASTSQYPTASQYNSDAQSSEAPSRYTADFVAQRTPSIVIHSDPVSISSDTSYEPMNPTSRSEASYIKDEAFVQPYFTDAPFAQLQPTTTESHPAPYLATVPSHGSSGNVSPFSPFSFSASWPETSSIYPQTQVAEPISFAFNSSSLTSPRIFSSNAQMPNWLESGTDVPPFPASAITSPSSSCAPAIAPVMIPSHMGGAPYPLAFVPPQDKYGSLDLETPLEEQQLGIELSLETKQHYLEAYWTSFDPLYPILHKASCRPAKNPLLTAAMMAIGAQYTYEPYSRGDSRILHGKCLELIAKYKDVLSSGSRQDYMQAIFLVEVYTQFKAKRSPPHLSDVFLSMYASLWKFHTNMGRSYIEGLCNVQPQLNDLKLRSQWAEWIAAMGYTRLLSACFVFESLYALTLARPFHSTPTSGFDLPVPALSALWDAADHHRWFHATQMNPPEVIDYSEALDRLCTGRQPALPVEPFHSAILIACHAASVLFQNQELQNAPFTRPSATHPIFEIEHASIIERVLCPHVNILVLHKMVNLAARTPLRALLATSGESWILSQRLSHEALIAAAEFTSLKSEMRAWTESAESTFFQGTAGDNVRAAVQYSLTILRLGVDAPPSSFSFGPDMALYYASLVLWAVTFGATSKATVAGNEFKDEDRQSFEAMEAKRDISKFCHFAQAALGRSLIDGIVPSDRLHDWSSAVSTVLQWSAWTLGGPDASANALGELMQNAVGVLGRLASRGWEGDWF